MSQNNNITYFAETDFRGKKTKFGIREEDRSKHVYVIGKTGMGKSTLLENMAIQDIQNGNGMAFIDPHGKTAELLLRYVPKHRIKDVIYFAPHDLDFPISFNVMEDVGKDQRHLVASGLMATFKKIWPDVWSARMEYISTNILLALLEYPDSTLLGVNRMLSDKAYRKKVVENLTDPSVKSFWVDEFAKYTEKLMTEAGASIQNKFGQFVSNPIIRNIIGQPKSSFDIREAMDNKKILIINLSKGRMGEINANLIGAMIITKIYLAAMSRANVSESNLKKLPSFFLYVDEFQSFVNDSFRDILSEARKYKLSLTIAHQYIEQVPEEVRDAVFGNVGTTISFRVGPFDAEVLEKVFAPKFVAEDIVNLGFAQIYLTLMIDGVGSPPFSAKTTLYPPPSENSAAVEEVVENSRKTYARSRTVVEEEIKKWHEPIEDEFDKNEAGAFSRSEGGPFKFKERGHFPSQTQEDNKRSFALPRTDRQADFRREPIRDIARKAVDGFSALQRSGRQNFSRPPVRDSIPQRDNGPVKDFFPPKDEDSQKRMSLDSLKKNIKDAQIPANNSLKDALSKALKNVAVVKKSDHDVKNTVVQEDKKKEEQGNVTSSPLSAEKEGAFSGAVSQVKYESNENIKKVTDVAGDKNDPALSSANTNVEASPANPPKSFFSKPSWVVEAENKTRDEKSNISSNQQKEIPKDVLEKVLTVTQDELDSALKDKKDQI